MKQTKCDIALAGAGCFHIGNLKTVIGRGGPHRRSIEGSRNEADAREGAREGMKSQDRSLSVGREIAAARSLECSAAHAKPREIQLAWPPRSHAKVPITGKSWSS